MNTIFEILSPPDTENLRVLTSGVVLYNILTALYNLGATTDPKRLDIIATSKRRDRYKVLIDGKLYGIWDVMRTNFID